MSTASRAVVKHARVGLLIAVLRREDEGGDVLDQPGGGELFSDIEVNVGNHRHADAAGFEA